MANYLGVNRAKTATLVAATVDHVTLAIRDHGITIFNHDTTSVIWARFDGTDPTVEGDDCIPIPASGAFEVDSMRQGFEDIRLISAGTPKYTVFGSW